MANENSIPYLDLNAASKIIGRECSSLSKAFFACKYEKGRNPDLCLKEAEAVMRCTEAVVNTLNAECPQFQTFKECVDLNDFNTHKCRKYEKPVYDFWNAKMGYTAQAADSAPVEKAAH